MPSAHKQVRCALPHQQRGLDRRAERVVHHPLHNDVGKSRAHHGALVPGHTRPGCEVAGERPTRNLTQVAARLLIPQEAGQVAGVAPVEADRRSGRRIAEGGHGIPRGNRFLRLLQKSEGPGDRIRRHARLHGIHLHTEVGGGLHALKAGAQAATPDVHYVEGRGGVRLQPLHGVAQIARAHRRAKGQRALPLLTQRSRGVTQRAHRPAFHRLAANQRVAEQERQAGGGGVLLLVLVQEALIDDVRLLQTPERNLARARGLHIFSVCARGPVPMTHAHQHRQKPA